MVSTRAAGAALEWQPQIPQDVSGQLLIPLPDGFEVSDAWWERLREAHDLVKLELTGRRELRVSMATNEGSRISVWVMHQFLLWLAQSGGGEAFDSVGEFVLPNGLRKRPDGCWVSAERMPLLPRPWSGIFRLTPDFVLEVRSPSQSVEMQQEKMEEWIEAGVRLGWLIDPYERTVWIYRASGEVFELDDPSELSGEDVCEGLVVDMSLVW